MEAVTVGVIGVGHLGRWHAGLFKEIADARLIGVYDTDQKKNEEKARELGVKAFSNLDELLAAVEAVSIVTPTTTHAEIARQALNNDRHVFIEKPIAHSLEAAQEIIDLAAEKQRILQIGHIERFNPAVKTLHDVPVNPLFIEAHRLASFNPRGTDVAVVLDLMIHDLDLILKLVGSKPSEIQASGVAVVSSTIDIANARIQFENGCVANLTASRISAKKMRKMRLFQKDAYISMDFSEGISEIFYIPNENQSPFHDGTLAVTLGEIESGSTRREIKYNRLQRQNVNPLKDELVSFVESIQNKVAPAVTGEDGLAALSLALQVIGRIDAHRRTVLQKNPQILPQVEDES